MDKEIAVSVIVATYNPQYGKLLQTLESIIAQENITVEIVVTDDGSKENHFDKMKAFFKNNKFSNYKLCSLDVNGGTVKNVYSGLKACSGEYVKVISPGDILTRKNTLYDWVQFMADTKTDISYGKAYYYNKDDEGIKYLKVLCHPQKTDIYVKRDFLAVKNYYLLANDIVNGATVLCRRVIFEKYLQMLVGKVIYAEDNAYRIMVADGIVPSFFDENVIFYEYGTGISTNVNRKWAELLKKDWLAADEEILPFIDNDAFRKKFKIVNSLKKNKSIYNKLKALLCIKERLSIRFSSPKYTDIYEGDGCSLIDILL